MAEENDQDKITTSVPCGSARKAGENETMKKSDDGAYDEFDRKLECAICLQTCIHPVKLPCRHIFCFLCVKGIANQSKRCAMCRREIPPDYLDRPNLLSTEDLDLNFAFEDGKQWFYEGRNGWWQYDERTSFELETAYKRGDAKCEVLVAGFLYTVDFHHMVQMRRNDPSRRRRIKRDVITISKKGVAGIRVCPEEATDEGIEESATGTAETQVCDDVAENGEYLSVTRVKVPSTTPATPSNTPQTPISGTDASVPSSPGRTTVLSSVDQSLVDALHILHIAGLNNDEPTYVLPQSSGIRQLGAHPWDLGYTEDEV